MADKSLITMFPVRVIPGGSPVLVITANGNSIEYPEFASWEDAIIHIDVTVFTGTTLQFFIEERDEVSGQWVALAPNPAIAAIVGTGHQRVVIGRSVGNPFAQRLRLRWTFTGTTVTVTVTAHVVNPTVVVGD